MPLRFIIALVVSALGAGKPPVTVTEGTVRGHSEWHYWTVTPDLSRARLAVAIKPGGGYLPDLVSRRALVAINGGYFEADFTPTSWLRDKTREYKRPSRHSKRGGVLAVTGGKAFIGRIKDLPFKAEFGVQNSPLLVDPGGKIGILSDNGRRAARTTACLDREERLHFILVQAPLGGGPTLKETAELLAAPPFACKVALNLDGGSSTGIWFSHGLRKESSPPSVPIGYAIEVERR